MKKREFLFGLACISLSIACFAQTDGSAKLEAGILDYNGSSTRHWTVVWVTTQSGTFIKTLRKQGPTITSSHWNSHCGQWYGAKAGSTALDGYSSATAANYTGTNSPVILTWNCRDASNNLMADGNYKFWVQYAEDNGQGPYTTSGLLWTKGLAASTNTYPNQGANFSSMKVTWTPSAPPPEAPTITSSSPTATGVVGVPYSFTCTATGTPPISFGASGLPSGLSISPTGLISGIPTTAGTFAGDITASNGTIPDASQAFSIVVSVVPASVTTLDLQGDNLVVSGTGPANGVFTVLTSTNAGLAMENWIPVSTQSIGAGGSFSLTNALDSSAPQRFYRLRVP